MKTTLLWSLLGLSLALNAALAIGHLRSEAARNGPPGDDAKDGQCLLDRLSLDREQQLRLAEMRRTMRERRTAYWRQAEAIKGELAEAICSSDMQPGALDAQLTRYAENQAAMQRAVAEHLRGVNAMLRPEQREGFRNLLRTEMFRGIRSLPGEAPGGVVEER